jgi:L,D-transpeptidase-like protein
VTRTARYLLLASFTLALGFCVPRAAKAQAPAASLQVELALAAPGLDAKVLNLALAAHDKAASEGLLANPNVLTVIDYSKPSVDPRFWVFDLASHKLLFEELVAHGRNSGDNIATRFSNAESSLESSLGLYVTSNVYMGKHGRSLKLNGLERGWNDNALARGIVVHAADYVTQAFATTEGRLGRSWGCPALNPAVAAKVIDVIKGGTAMFAYYPDSTWLSSSQFLDQAADSDTIDSQVDSAFALAGAETARVGFRARLAAWADALIDWAQVFDGRIAPIA